MSRVVALPESSAKLVALLAKVPHFDKDERYMAVLDIQTELLKGPKIDAALEKKLCAAILDRIETDTSNDVQAVSVKCLSVLVKKAQEAQVVEVTSRLCRQILEGSAELRDVYGIGMKTLVADADEKHGRAVAETAAPFLLRGLASSAAADVRSEALDLATELLRRFGALPEVAARLHEPFLAAFVAQLAGPTPLVRKRAAAAIGALSPVLSDALLEALVSALLCGIEGGGSRPVALSGSARTELATTAAAASARTLIQCVCTVARQVGARLGRHLPRVVPILLGQLGSPDDEVLASEAGAELRENCLAAFESILPQCPQRAAPFVPAITDAARIFAKFDPNYAYGGDEDDEAAEEDGDDDDDGGYGDEDDPSWKVRRSALRVLHAVIAAGPRAGGTALLPSLGPLLVSCLREREEAVRLEALAAVAALAQASVAPAALGEWDPDMNAAAALFAPLGKSQGQGDGGATPGSASTAQASVVGGHFNAAFSELLDAAALGLGASALVPEALSTVVADASAAADVDMTPVDSATSLSALPAAGQAFVALVPTLLRAILALLGGRKVAATVKTRVAALALLRSVAVALCLTGEPRHAGAAALRPFLAQLFRALVDAAKERGHSQATGIRQQAAATLHALLLVFSASPEDIAASAGLLVAPIVAEIRDDYFKLQAQGLLSSAVLLTTLRPASGSRLGALLVPEADFALHVASLLGATTLRFEAQGVDVEVKDSAVVAVAALLAHAGDVPAVAAAAPALLSILVSRLRSETTRMTALRALSYIAASPVRVDLAPVLQPALTELAACLRQQARALRVQALQTLCAVVAAQIRSCTAAMLRSVLNEIADGPSATLSDGDLQLARVSLDAATTLLSLRSDAIASALETTVLPRALALSSSPVVQGAAQTALLRFFQASAAANLGSVAPGFGFEAMLGGLLDSVSAHAAATATATASSGSAMQRSCQNAARCVAVLCSDTAAPPDAVRAAALRFLQEGTGSLPTRVPAFRALALYALGEVGRHIDIPVLLAAPPPPAAGAKRRKSDGTAALPVPGALMAIFGDASEDLRSAAAVALGGVAVGSPELGLPAVLGALLEAATAAQGGAGGGGSERVYLLMTAIREVLVRRSAGAVLVQALLPTLLSPAIAASPDEGIRGAAAECLGRLVSADPALVAVLCALSGSASPAARFTALASLRYATESPSTQAALCSPFVSSAVGTGSLSEWLPAPTLRELAAASAGAAAAAGLREGGPSPPSNLAVLLGSLLDTDISVRLAAATAVTALAHSSPLALLPLLRPVRPDLFPLLKAAEEASVAAIAAAAAAGGEVEAASTRPPPGSVPAGAGYASQGVVGALLFHAMRHRDLVIEIQLGPFTHVKDEGLPLRKAALGALEAVAGSRALAERLTTDAMPFLLASLADDQPDVRALCHAVLSKLAVLASSGSGPEEPVAAAARGAPAAMAMDSGITTGADAWFSTLVAALPSIAAALDATVSKVAAAVAAAAGGGAAGGPPVSLDSARSALRVLDVLQSSLPAAAALVPALAGLVAKVQANDVLARLFAAVKADRVG